MTPYLLGLNITASFAGVIVGMYGSTQLICRLPHVSRIGLLPYHRYGVKKYALLGRDYALEQVPVQAEHSVAQARDLLARATGREVRSGI